MVTKNKFIPAYIINLSEREDRLKNVLNEFKGKREFDVKIINAVKHKIGAMGLWMTIQKIIQFAIKNDDDVIIICEDDHQFTSAYNKKFLFENIIEAHYQGCDLLSGGVSGNFKSEVIPISRNRFWIQEYWCNQFIVVYRSLFERILSHKFDIRSKVDLTISELTDKKMFLFPFISIQKIYEYSDVTARNNNDLEWLQTRFSYATERLILAQNVYKFYSRTT